MVYNPPKYRTRKKRSSPGKGKPKNKTKKGGNINNNLGFSLIPQNNNVGKEGFEPEEDKQDQKTGAQGDQGDQGAQGDQGDQGAQGDQGDQGAQGDQGDQGAQGDQGDQGAQGDQGDQGAQGDQGDQGAQGDQGDQGAQGDQGDQGAQGDQGDQGAQGDQGDQGAQGDQGDQGAQGDQGDQGAQGDQGDQGAQGDQGDQGAQGDQGDQGAQGDQGDQGAQGDQGDQGAQGTTGAQGDEGDQGAQGTTGAQGDEGDQGAQGATGDQGAQGDTGAAEEPEEETNIFLNIGQEEIDSRLENQLDELKTLKETGVEARKPEEKKRMKELKRFIERNYKISKLLSNLNTELVNTIQNAEEGDDVNELVNDFIESNLQEDIPNNLKKILQKLDTETIISEYNQQKIVQEETINLKEINEEDTDNVIISPDKMDDLKNKRQNLLEDLKNKKNTPEAAKIEKELKNIEEQINKQEPEEEPIEEEPVEETIEQQQTQEEKEKQDEINKQELEEEASSLLENLDSTLLYNSLTEIGDSKMNVLEKSNYSIKYDGTPDDYNDSLLKMYESTIEDVPKEKIMELLEKRKNTESNNEELTWEEEKILNNYDNVQKYRKEKEEYYKLQEITLEQYKIILKEETILNKKLNIESELSKYTQEGYTDDDKEEKIKEFINKYKKLKEEENNINLDKQILDIKKQRQTDNEELKKLKNKQMLIERKNELLKKKENDTLTATEELELNKIKDEKLTEEEKDQIKKLTESLNKMFEEETSLLKEINKDLINNIGNLLRKKNLLEKEANNTLSKDEEKELELIKKETGKIFTDGEQELLEDQKEIFNSIFTKRKGTINTTTDLINNILDLTIGLTDKQVIETANEILENYTLSDDAKERILNLIAESGNSKEDMNNQIKNETEDLLKLEEYKNASDFKKNNMLINVLKQKILNDETDLYSELDKRNIRKYIDSLENNNRNIIDNRETLFEIKGTINVDEDLEKKNPVLFSAINNDSFIFKASLREAVNSLFNDTQEKLLNNLTIPSSLPPPPENFIRQFMKKNKLQIRKENINKDQLNKQWLLQNLYESDDKTNFDQKFKEYALNELNIDIEQDEQTRNMYEQGMFDFIISEYNTIYENEKWNYIINDPNNITIDRSNTVVDEFSSFKNLENLLQNETIQNEFINNLIKNTGNIENIENITRIKIKKNEQGEITNLDKLKEILKNNIFSSEKGIKNILESSPDVLNSITVGLNIVNTDKAKKIKDLYNVNFYSTFEDYEKENPEAAQKIVIELTTFPEETFQLFKYSDDYSEEQQENDSLNIANKKKILMDKLREIYEISKKINEDGKNESLEEELITLQQQLDNTQKEITDLELQREEKKILTQWKDNDFYEKDFKKTKFYDNILKYYANSEKPEHQEIYKNAEENYLKAQSKIEEQHLNQSLYNNVNNIMSRDNLDSLVNSSNGISDNFDINLHNKIKRIQNKINEKKRVIEHYKKLLEVRTNGTVHRDFKTTFSDRKYLFDKIEMLEAELTKPNGLEDQLSDEVKKQDAIKLGGISDVAKLVNEKVTVNMLNTMLNYGGFGNLDVKFTNTASVKDKKQGRKETLNTLFVKAKDNTKDIKRDDLKSLLTSFNNPDDVNYNLLLNIISLDDNSKEANNIMNEFKNINFFGPSKDDIRQKIYDIQIKENQADYEGKIDRGYEHITVAAAIKPDSTNIPNEYLLNMIGWTGGNNELEVMYNNPLFGSYKNDGGTSFGGLTYYKRPSSINTFSELKNHIATMLGQTINKKLGQTTNIKEKNDRINKFNNLVNYLKNSKGEVEVDKVYEISEFKDDSGKDKSLLSTLYDDITFSRLQNQEVKSRKSFDVEYKDGKRYNAEDGLLTGGLRADYLLSKFNRLQEISKLINSKNYKEGGGGIGLDDTIYAENWTNRNFNIEKLKKEQEEIYNSLAQTSWFNINNDGNVLDKNKDELNRLRREFKEFVNSDSVYDDRTGRVISREATDTSSYLDVNDWLNDFQNINGGTKAVEELGVPNFPVNDGSILQAKIALLKSGLDVKWEDIENEIIESIDKKSNESTKKYDDLEIKYNLIDSLNIGSKWKYVDDEQSGGWVKKEIRDNNFSYGTAGDDAIELLADKLQYIAKKSLCTKFNVSDHCSSTSNTITEFENKILNGIIGEDWKNDNLWDYDKKMIEKLKNLANKDDLIEKFAKQQKELNEKLANVNFSEEESEEKLNTIIANLNNVDEMFKNTEWISDLKYKVRSDIGDEQRKIYKFTIQKPIDFEYEKIELKDITDSMINEYKNSMTRKKRERMSELHGEGERFKEEIRKAILQKKIAELEKKNRERWNDQHEGLDYYENLELYKKNNNRNKMMILEKVYSLIKEPIANTITNSKNNMENLFNSTIFKDDKTTLSNTIKNADESIKTITENIETIENNDNLLEENKKDEIAKLENYIKEIRKQRNDAIKDLNSINTEGQSRLNEQHQALIKLYQILKNNGIKDYDDDIRALEAIRNMRTTQPLVTKVIPANKESRDNTDYEDYVIDNYKNVLQAIYDKNMEEYIMGENTNFDINSDFQFEYGKMVVKPSMIEEIKKHFNSTGKEFTNEEINKFVNYYSPSNLLKGINEKTNTSSNIISDIEKILSKNPKLQKNPNIKFYLEILKNNEIKLLGDIRSKPKRDENNNKTLLGKIQTQINNMFGTSALNETRQNKFIKKNAGIEGNETVITYDKDGNMEYRRIKGPISQIFLGEALNFGSVLKKLYDEQKAGGSHFLHFAELEDGGIEEKANDILGEVLFNVQVRNGTHNFISPLSDEEYDWVQEYVKGNVVSDLTSAKKIRNLMFTRFAGTGSMNLLGHYLVSYMTTPSEKHKNSTNKSLFGRWLANELFLKNTIKNSEKNTQENKLYQKFLNKNYDNLNAVAKNLRDITRERNKTKRLYDMHSKLLDMDINQDGEISDHEKYRHENQMVLDIFENIATLGLSEIWVNQNLSERKFGNYGESVSKGFEAFGKQLLMGFYEFGETIHTKSYVDMDDTQGFLTGFMPFAGVALTMVMGSCGKASW